MTAAEQLNLMAWYQNLSEEAQQTWTDLIEQVRFMRQNNKIIYPPQEDIFNALKFCHPDNVKAVIVGQDPYHGPNQAMGMSFSVRDGVPHPPSLVNILKELSDDIGCEYPKSGNLTKWETEGVLLLNTVLTVEAHKAFSHKELGWQKVTTEIIKTIIANGRPTVFIAWGNPAKQLIDDCASEIIGTHPDQNEFCQMIWNTNFGICSTHPSPLSAYKNTRKLNAFIGNRPFSKTNRILQKHGVKPIDWTLE